MAGDPVIRQELIDARVRGVAAEKTAPTPYFADESITLYQGDCRELLPLLDLSDVAAVIADPPYAETNLLWDQWQDGWLDVLAATVPESAPLWCFGSMRMFLDRRDEFSAWSIAQELIGDDIHVVWEKHNGSSFANDRFKRVHEHVVQWYRGAWADQHRDVPTTDDATARTVRRKPRPPQWHGAIDYGTYTSIDGGPRLMRSVIKVRSEHGRAIHPTQKPLGIITPLLEFSVPAGGLVLDPFCGSGSTLRAAKDGGWRAIGIEADERYLEGAVERLGQEVLAI